MGHAIDPDYVCLPSGNAFAWSLFTREAVLFDDDDRQIITHDFGPYRSKPAAHSPSSGIPGIRAPSRGRGVQSSTDSQFVAPGAIPWLLVNVKDVGAQAGPTGGRG